MIKKFDKSTALLLVDTQNGVNDTQYYGGENGRRNNPRAEENILSLLYSTWGRTPRKTPRGVNNFQLCRPKNPNERG